MAIEVFDNKTPNIAASAYIHDKALLIGDVSIGENSSIWPMCVLRGDINSINIGKNTNVQDGTIIHVNHASLFNPKGDPTLIGDNVTIGHQAVIHACSIDNESLIGIGSIIMDKAIIKAHVIVGAGSLVPPGKILESGYLWLGNPVKKVRPLTEKELEYLIYSGDYYAKLAKRYS